MGTTGETLAHVQRLPSVDELFRRQPANDLDDDVVFERAAELENPLTTSLVASLRKIRELRQTVEAYRTTLKAAIESLHLQQREIQGLRRRNLQLVDELRATRRDLAA